MNRAPFFGTRPAPTEPESGLGHRSDGPRGAGVVAARASGTTVCAAQKQTRPAQQKGAPLIEKLSTRDLIAESYLDLMYRTDIRKVSMQQIAENCGVSKRTVYNHFEDRRQLDIYAFVYMTDKQYRTYSQTGTYFDYQLDNIRLSLRARATLRDNDDYTFLVKAFTESLSEHVASTFPDGQIDERTQFALSYYVAGASYEIGLWAQEQMGDTTAEELTQRILEQIPAHLRKRLTFAKGFWREN